MNMQQSVVFEDVVVIEPDVYRDHRGMFSELYSQQKLSGLVPCVNFVQDNISRSNKNVLRGLHYQIESPQGKLVTVLDGVVFDVCVDLRHDSSTYGRHFGILLSSDNHHMMYIPKGFAHGFCVLSDTALFYYKCTDYYNPAGERGIRWDDPTLAIGWPLRDPQISKKDRQWPLLDEISPVPVIS